MKKLTCCWYLIILINSCIENNCKRYFYQNSNKLREERVYQIKGDTADYDLKTYYTDGQISSKGQVKNSNKIGFWQEWYVDGTLKWKGNYENNRRKLKIPVSGAKVILMDSLLKKDQFSQLRIKVEGIHPNDIIIECKNGIIKNSDNKSMFDFMVKPGHLGMMNFVLFVRANGETILIGKDSINVKEY